MAVSKCDLAVYRLFRTGTDFFKHFCLRPKVDDFLRWKGMPGGVVYGRMMDLCCLYGPETTDSMDIEFKRG